MDTVNYPPTEQFFWDWDGPESHRANSAWSVYNNALHSFDADWLGSSAVDVAAILYAGWMLDHYIDESVEAVLPSTAISIGSIEELFRNHGLISHREPWSRALAAPPEVQQEAVALSRNRAGDHWLKELRSSPSLSNHTIGAATRHARELIGGRSELREWAASYAFLAAWLIYADNLIKTKGSGLPEIDPAHRYTQKEVGKAANEYVRFKTTTLDDDQRAAAIELAMVGYEAFRIQLEQGVPGATASEIAWAEHGPLKTVVAPPPPPRTFKAAPGHPGVAVYFFDKTGSAGQKLGAFSDAHTARVSVAIRMWKPGADPKMVAGDYVTVLEHSGEQVGTWHITDDLNLTYEDDPDEMPVMILEGWLRDTGIPTPRHLVKPKVTRAQSKAAKSRNWKVLASDLPLLIRTDFSDDALWAEIRDVAMSERPFINGGGETAQANILPVDDPAFAKATTLTRLLNLPWPDPETEEGPVYFFVVDKQTIKHPEHPILAVSLYMEKGQNFRLTPEAMALIEVNLSIANLGFEDFGTGPDGIEREA